MEKHVRVETANPVVGQVPIRTHKEKKKKSVSGVLTFVRSHFSPCYSRGTGGETNKNHVLHQRLPDYFYACLPSCSRDLNSDERRVSAPRHAGSASWGYQSGPPPTLSIGTFRPLNVNERMQNRRASVQASVALCPRAP